MITFFELVIAFLLWCFVIITGVWCWIFWTHRHVIRAASKLPSLFPTIPILGSLHYARFTNEQVTGLVFDAVQKLRSEGIYTACLWIGPYPVILVSGEEDLQKVNSCIKVPEKGFEVDSTKFVLGNGIFNAPGDIWKTTRRAIEPIFHPRNIKQLMPTFNRNSREMVSRFSQYDGKGTFDISHIVVQTALQTICHLTFGSDFEFDINSKGFLSLINILKTPLDIALRKTFRFWLQWDFLFNYLYKKEIKDIDLQWRAFSDAPLKMALNKIKDSYSEKGNFEKNNHEDETQFTDQGPLNLVAVHCKLQQNYPEFTEEDLKLEIITMYLAGSDSVSSGASFCLLLLAYHQDIQERLYEEITSTIDNNSDVTYDDLQNMPYLDQVLKETLRWSIVVPFASRRAPEDIKLSSITIPKGCSFVVGLSGPLLDSNVYPNHTKFNPENFLPQNSLSRHKSAYLPFNAGPRQCIGKQYAEILLKTLVIHVIRKFKVSTSMDIYKLKRKMSFFIYSSEGYNISIQRRSG